MTNPFILVVDDEPDIRNLVQEILEDEGYIVSVAGNGADARAALKEQRPDLVLLDIWMPDEDGITLLKDLKQSGQLGYPVVMISGHGTVETAVEATRHGAVDFIEKPLSLAKLLLTVEKALQTPVLADISDKPVIPVGFRDEIIGTSEYVKGLRAQIPELAKIGENVLISGEPATGKALLAMHIHAASARASGSFITLSCDSLSTSSSSRELLGESGHGQLNSGYLESAIGGTLYLKDVEELPKTAQTILLEVLEKREIRRVGSLTRIASDINVISSTTENLVFLVRRGDFLPELYTHLSEQALECKSLREHPEDIPVLLAHYVSWFVENESLPYRHFTVAAQNRLRNLDWPGNMLELKNLIQRLMILGAGVEVDVAEINDVIGGSKGSATPIDVSLDLPLREARAAFERLYMLHQLQLVEGNIGELAKRVGMERTHLYRKLRSLEIDLGKVRD